jgi:DNA-binding NtrC family response regulator
VLLDEIGELEPNVQRKLLRVLERSEVLRLGSEVPRRVDVRVIATTRLDLDKLVQDGLFREDLYYRLVVSRVELPPLRRRASDVAVLVRHFWRELGGTDEPSPSLLAQLGRQAWPGNVRELRNRVARIVAFGEAPIAPSEPPPPPAPAAEAGTTPSLSPSRGAVFDRVLGEDLPLARAREIVVSEFERAYVDKVLAANGGNVAKAAAASGLARRYFQLLRAKRRLSG